MDSRRIKWPVSVNLWKQNFTIYDRFSLPRGKMIFFSSFWIDEKKTKRNFSFSWHHALVENRVSTESSSVRERVDVNEHSFFTRDTLCISVYLTYDILQIEGTVLAHLITKPFISSSEYRRKYGLIFFVQARLICRQNICEYAGKFEETNGYEYSIFHCFEAMIKDRLKIENSFLEAWIFFHYDEIP